MLNISLDLFRGTQASKLVPPEMLVLKSITTALQLLKLPSNIAWSTAQQVSYTVTGRPARPVSNHRQAATRRGCTVCDGPRSRLETERLGQTVLDISTSVTSKTSSSLRPNLGAKQTLKSSRLVSRLPRRHGGTAGTQGGWHLSSRIPIL